MLFFGGVIFITILIFFLVLNFMSSGKPKQFLDKNGNVLNNSISEKVFLEINGVRHGCL